MLVYWLLGSLIIIVMMGVLAVADSMTLPVSPLLADLSATATLPLLLTILTIVLLVVSQRRFSFPHSFNVKTPLAQNASLNSTTTSSYNLSLLSKCIRYFLLAGLSLALIIGSGLLALMSHQEAQNSAIKQPLRVQALVSIEGISDSVYDIISDIGYRQVATISQISPLLSELTAQDLEKLTAQYAANYREALDNSLSKNKENKDDLSGDSAETFADFDKIEYRVLLNAYPKKPKLKKPSKKYSTKQAKNPFKQSQMTDLNHLQPGDQLLMTLTLTPLANSEQAINNPTGFDSYRWLRGRHIDGVANILATSNATIPFDDSLALSTADNSYLQRFRTAIDQGRWQLRQHFYQDWVAQTTAQQQAKAVTLSLLTGDRSLINRDTKDLYQLAGISHLLAISGTHVLFLAIVLAGLAVLLLNRFYPSLYRYIPRWQVRWWVMISAAFIYALFTGFDVPAARTAWMLLAIGLIRLTLLPISTMRILLALAVLMAWLDPYVLWQAGYWLSFIAVALLLKYEDSSVQSNQAEFTQLTVFSHDDNTSKHMLKRMVLGFKRLFKLQFWLFIALLPITLLLFGKASLLGLVVNLFAIGLFGWVIVPLNLLAGLCYLIVPTLADAIWALVIALVAYLHELMTWLTALPIFSGAWLYTPVNMAILLMVSLAMLPWLLPRGLISRWLALPPLTLLVMTVYANQQSLITTPTLYILPTGDQYVSAVLLQYPVIDSENVLNNKGASAIRVNKKNVSWLFLADHRPHDIRTMPSTLTADKLSATLEQQLHSLSIKRLEGIVVQSSSAALTYKLSTSSTGSTKNSKTLKTATSKTDNSNPSSSDLLPMTVTQLSQRFPTAQYWQAGRSERWPELQRAYQTTSQAKTYATISAQGCEQGKVWQLANGDLALQAITGWSKINDASVWDCTLAIDSGLPIQVINYNAAEPLKSLSTKIQTLQSDIEAPTPQTKNPQSRLILNADTHPRVWQMWSLLCAIEPNAKNDTLNNALNNPINSTTWLGHSTSHISADVISEQQIHEIITYDNKPLDAALSFNTDSKD